MQKDKVLKMSFLLFYVGLGSWFVYQGIHAQHTTADLRENMIEQRQEQQKIDSDIRSLTAKKTVTKEVDLTDFDRKTKDVALLMYNTSFANDKELQLYKEKVSTHVTPKVLETISAERMPTVWNKQTKTPQYRVSNMGRMQVEKNGINYLVTLTPVDKHELKIILQMHYNVQSGLVDDLRAERELTTHANE